MGPQVDQEVVDALIGTAVKLLAEKGASAELLGSFAAAYPQQVHAILGRPRAEAPAPDLEQAILAAMHKFVQQGSLVPAGMDKERGTERVYVQIAGQRTSVSVKKPLLGRLSEQLGSPEAAKKKVREVAALIPQDAPSGSRSDWIERQLHAFVALGQIAPSGELRH